MAGQLGGLWCRSVCRRSVSKASTHSVAVVARSFRLRSQMGKPNVKPKLGNQNMEPHRLLNVFSLSFFIFMHFFRACELLKLFAWPRLCGKIRFQRFWPEREPRKQLSVLLDARRASFRGSFTSQTFGLSFVVPFETPNKRSNSWALLNQIQRFSQHDHRMIADHQSFRHFKGFH